MSETPPQPRTSGTKFGSSPAAAARARSCANLLAVFEKFLQDADLFLVKMLDDLFLAKFRDDLLVFCEHFLDLHRIIGKKLGRRVDTGQTAADDDSGQANLQIRQRIFFECTG